MEAVLIGTQLGGRYEILRELGRGGMGVVYVAHDPLLGRNVAVKVLDPRSLSEGATLRLEREARCVARMDHPNVIAVYDIGRVDGALFFVMPLIQGPSLRALLNQRILTQEEVIAIAVQTAEALQYSHSIGVVHRDIKPENILLSEDESGALHAVVTDFGLALRSQEQRLTDTGAILGTVAYMSPERLQNRESDGRSDLYALGVLMYESLSGQPPFARDVPAVFRDILESPAAPFPSAIDIDDELARLVLWCLEKEPSRRPQRASDLAARLRALGRTRTAQSTADPTRPVKRAAIERPLIGRERETAMMTATLDEVIRDREMRLLLIAGEAGIGKTRLVEELAAAARSRGVRTLVSRFADRAEGFPYQGICDLFIEHFVTAGGSARRDWADLAPQLVSVFPGLRELFGDADAAGTGAGVSDQGQIFELFARTLSRIAGDDPIAVCLEELHEAEVSIDALQYMVNRLAPTPTLFVGTYRETEVEASHALRRLIGAYSSDRRLRAVNLEPLDAARSSSLISALLGGGEPDPRMASSVFDAASGNPFFTIELVRMMIDDASATEPGHSTFSTSLATEVLPETIQQAIGKRVDRLPDAQRDVLRVASVLGRAIQCRDLRALVPEPDDALDALVAGGLLREDPGSRTGRLAFPSGIVRQVVYASIPARRRRSLHLRVAELLEERNRTAPERAASDLLIHYSRADVADKTIEYGLMSGRTALRSCGALDAIHAASVVLEFADEDDDARAAADARMITGAAMRLAGRHTEAERELARAHKLYVRIGDEGSAFEAIVSAAESAWEARLVGLTESWIERGLPLAASGTTAPARRLLTLAATVANLRGDHTRARELLAAILPLREESSAPIAARRGTLRIPIAGDLRSLDPARTFTIAQLEALSPVFETLLAEGSGLSAEPKLAEAIEIVRGGREVHIRLRDGVRFHDGRPLTSADVRYSLERLLRHTESENRWLLDAIDGAVAFGDGQISRLPGISTPSPSEIRIALSRPVSFFPSLLAYVTCAIVPDGFEIGQSERPPGTGPYRVAEFDPSALLTLEANPSYWRRGLPRSERLEFHLSVPPEEIASGLRAGIYSIIWDLPPNDLNALLGDLKFAASFRETPALATYYIALNARRGPLSDRGLRREILRSIDTEPLIRDLGRVAIRASGLIPPGLLGHVERPSAGAESPRPSLGIDAGVMLNSSYRGPYASLTSRLFSAFEEIGVHLRLLDARSEYYANQAEALAAADLLFTRWIADYPDAHGFVALLQRDGGLIGGLCGSERTDRLIEKGESETDPKIRHEVYREIEDILVEDALILPLFHEQSYRFAAPNVRGFALNQFPPIVSYETLWLDERY